MSGRPDGCADAAPEAGELDASRREIGHPFCVIAEDPEFAERQRRFTAERQRAERYGPNLIGLDEATAVASAIESGFTVKLRRPETLTRERELCFDASRLNLTVEGNIVTAVAVG